MDVFFKVFIAAILLAGLETVESASSKTPSKEKIFAEFKDMILRDPRCSIENVTRDEGFARYKLIDVRCGARDGGRRIYPENFTMVDECPDHCVDPMTGEELNEKQYRVVNITYQQEFDDETGRLTVSLPKACVCEKKPEVEETSINRRGKGRKKGRKGKGRKKGSKKGRKRKERVSRGKKS